MRELKFRYVWKRKEDGHIWTEIVPIECLETRGDTPYVHHSYCYDIWELISRDQFTGLHDKNGVEIYEGDIVTDGEITGYVEYCNNYACGAYEIMTSESTSVVNENIDNWNDFEVIGNIHEHGHLLKGSK